MGSSSGLQKFLTFLYLGKAWWKGRDTRSKAYQKHAKINFYPDSSNVLANICTGGIFTVRLGDMLLECKLLISSKEDKERKYLSQSTVYNLTHNTNNPEHFRETLTSQTSINT